VPPRNLGSDPSWFPDAMPGRAVTGPKLVTVEHGSSLAVSCSYRPRYKLNSKYWCLKNSLLFCLTYIIQTDGSEVTVTRDRVSIRDNHTANSFTVTLSSVTLGDAGRYSCGVKRKLRRNARHSIKVMVSVIITPGRSSHRGAVLWLSLRDRTDPAGAARPRSGPVPTARAGREQPRGPAGPFPPPPPRLHQRLPRPLPSSLRRPQCPAVPGIPALLPTG
uniref:Ig-like domain-containing protein n=1 Tax=Cyanoderma ruficeps TaxID=181631 RepID=A0A8C3NYM4_9PASS